MSETTDLHTEDKNSSGFQASGSQSPKVYKGFSSGFSIFVFLVPDKYFTVFDYLSSVLY